jgi:hypothetical protein
MSLVAAMTQVQTTLQLYLFAAMLVHMARHFSYAEAAPETPAAPSYERDDIPLWPYAA